MTLNLLLALLFLVQIKILNRSPCVMGSCIKSLRDGPLEITEGGGGGGGVEGEKFSVHEFF